MEGAPDILSKVDRLHEKARSMVVNLGAAEVSGLREKIDKLTDEVEAKDLELQIMSGLVAETAILWEETAKPR